MRLFASITFPRSIDRVVKKTSDTLKVQVTSGKFVPVENYHLTLAFIGETKNVDDAIAALNNGVNKSALKPFVVFLEGCGRFDDTWLVRARRSEELFTLAKNVRHSLRDAGFELDRSYFKPHITIARNVVIPTPPEIYVPHVGARIDYVSLMKSETIDKNTVYTEIHRKMI